WQCQSPAPARTTRRCSHGHQMAPDGTVGRLLSGHDLHAGRLGSDRPALQPYLREPAMTATIHHDPQARLFYCDIENRRSVIEYELADAVMSITHTRVPPELEGRGIAGQLTRFALETAKNQQWKVRHVCSYAVVYMRRHPEYADLLA